ncbi:cyclophilin-like protein [Guyanagaster necrorhizus]|uniref:Cyclophilin-like protein n=1 Tax=Guyanagaster necrorhizus TaxID=856835 RepID=A0A9P7VNW1_9AGAR|nr:cyclophilin-like protein [Guyanagaster necrorhizus MCA 3950]KAG7443336.1 cyclophilin-like protein [Guyanagaster necrorhizus MCA 3950]
MALPTKGRVIIDTTVGEIDIELWSKETPKTCRNFLTLAMEGYYDGVIFHRVVPGFLVQTGDKTGTGAGGESIYGDVFEDEIHPRLRFAHRGLVAMANNGKKNSNDSQFIITLDRADELHGKHTLFGRLVGDTVYNVMKIGDMELDSDGRPLYPPKIKGIRIVDNPFEDIVPRITAEERRAQARAREQAQREREEMERRKGAKKSDFLFSNVKLLSFDDDNAEEEVVSFKKKGIARTDLAEDPRPSVSIPDFVRNPPKTSVKTPQETPEMKANKKKAASDLTKIREQHAQGLAAGENARKDEIEKMEAEIRKLTKRRDGYDSDDERAAKRTKKSFLEEELSKYSKGRGLRKRGKRRDEGGILAALDSFRGKLQGTMLEEEPEPLDEAVEPNVESVPGPDDPGMEVDDDRGFLGHALRFPKDDGEESRKAERDYEVIDPRQRNARAKEEERERRRAMKAKGGRGGRRR